MLCMIVVAVSDVFYAIDFGPDTDHGKIDGPGGQGERLRGARTEKPQQNQAYVYTCIYYCYYSQRPDGRHLMGVQTFCTPSHRSSLRRGPKAARSVTEVGEVVGTAIGAVLSGHLGA